MTNHDIQIAELELTGVCNLRCPLCISVTKPFLFRKFSRSIVSWTNQLDQFDSLKTVTICGQSSEPTLYIDFLQLIQYFNKRNIKIILYTNGNTHNQKWWKKLGTILKKNDQCIFTVCGSTQQLHEYYRVGSSLDELLKNIKAFTNANKNDYVHYIQFQYNKSDYDNATRLLKQFSNSAIIKSVFYNEKYHTIPNSKGICMEKKDQILFDMIMKFSDNEKPIYKCQCLEEKSIFIDNIGNIYPCTYAMINNIKLQKTFSYSYLHDNKFNFCKECKIKTQDMLFKTNLEGFNGNI